jgi:hypothetical protein
MPLIAVAADLFAPGIQAPGGENTFDWRAIPSSPANTAQIPAAYEVDDLATLLATSWRSDAHFVAYILRGPDGEPLARQPRVAKAGLPWLLDAGYSLTTDLLVADVEPTSTAPPATCLHFHDGRRLRLVQPLRLTVDIAEADAIAEGWLRGLELAGLHPLDPPDWTRHHRLPITTRGRRLVSCALAGAATPIEPPAPAAPRTKRPRVHLPVAQNAPALPSADVAARALLDALRHVGEGLTFVEAACGLGKSHAARTVALARAKKLHGPTSSGLRAPLDSKTAISTPTGKLSTEYLSKLLELDPHAPVARLFGPLSLLGPDGAPVCKYADIAGPLAAGGQSVRAVLCDNKRAPCDLRETCPARPGREGPEDARIFLGPHQLLGQLSAAAGTTGLLLIDEPPDMLETVLLKAEEIAAADELLRKRFEARYATCMAPALRAVRWWVELTAPLDEPGPLTRALADGVDEQLLLAAMDYHAEDALDAVRIAFAPDHRGTTPPIEPHHLRGLRSATRGLYERGVAAQLGSASRVLGALRRALIAGPGQTSARVEDRLGVRVLVLSLPNEALTRSVLRDGKTVILDANADLRVPVLGRLLADPPRVLRFAAADGAPVSRTLYRTRSATRSGWFAAGRLVPSAGAIAAIEAVVEWALEDATTRADGTPRQLGIIAIHVVELVLRAALGEDVRAAWKGQRQAEKTLIDCAAILAPILARLPAPPVVAHYGAIRGLDHWRGLDQLATIGDPWPPLGEVQLECDLLELSGGWELRAEAYARAELEQAHGRLRTIHRTAPARALHVGLVLPGRWEAAQPPVELREPAEGRPKTVAAMDVAELGDVIARHGGRRALAKAVGVNESTLGGYLRGLRGVPPALAITLRELAPGPAVDGAPHGVAP